jgi:hypothetical protein
MDGWMDGGREGGMDGQYAVNTCGKRILMLYKCVFLPSLQIRYQNFDAVWVLQKSEEIPLMEKLHPLNQNKFANIMHTSPSSFPEEEFELKADDLFNFLDNLKKQEREEEKRLKEVQQRKLLRQYSSFGTSAFGGGGDFDSGPQQGTARTDEKKNTARGEEPKVNSVHKKK